MNVILEFDNKEIIRKIIDPTIKDILQNGLTVYRINALNKKGIVKRKSNAFFVLRKEIIRTQKKKRMYSKNDTTRKTETVDAYFFFY